MFCVIFLSDAAECVQRSIDSTKMTIVAQTSEGSVTVGGVDMLFRALSRYFYLLDTLKREIVTPEDLIREEKDQVR